MSEGKYGKSSVPVSDEIRGKIIGDEEVITVRPADLLEPQLEAAKLLVKEYYEQEEDVLTYALFPQVAENFFKYRAAKKYKIDDSLVNMEDKTYPI